MTHPSDRLAFDRAMVTQPVWNRFSTGAEALGQADNVLLHAGPPFAGVDAITDPIMNSACVAAVYERLAADFATAEAMIRAEEVVLRPAQDEGVVTPLAAVVSASMPLHCVYDAWGGAIRAYAPINGGVGPSLRLGLRDRAVLDHIRWLNTAVRDVLAAGIGEGIALVPMAHAGVRSGDDCHGFTPHAGGLLAAEIADRSRRAADPAVREFIDASPSLFLNLWMAATKCMMLAANGTPGAAMITAAGGNGRAFGLQIAGRPGEWITVPAAPPAGDGDMKRALGAIGDSAVVDCFGLGAMAFAHAPKQMAALGHHLPDGFLDRRPGLGIGRHPTFRGLDLPLGCSARDPFAPVISLGILDRDGKEGRIGGGVYPVPGDLCAAALAALD